MIRIYIPGAVWFALGAVFGVLFTGGDVSALIHLVEQRFPWLPF